MKCGQIHIFTEELFNIPLFDLVLSLTCLFLWDSVMKLVDNLAKVMIFDELEIWSEPAFISELHALLFMAAWAACFKLLLTLPELNNYYYYYYYYVTNLINNPSQAGLAKRRNRHKNG